MVPEFLLAFVLMGACSGEVKLKLYTGGEMPAIALGTYLGFDEHGIIRSTNKQLRDVILRAIELGYRHFDTASVYETEEDIGEAIRMKIEEEEIDRGDVFITTKMGACSGEVKLKLYTGGEMPAIALGTYLGFDEHGIIRSTNKQLRDVILRAIELGYRHFDTASVYETEEDIGEAIRMKIEEEEIDRGDVFITTKLWNTEHKREQVPTALRASLKKMELNYIDLYLMHWPIALNDDYSHSNVDFMETWRGLEDAQRLGLTKAIGVSNFNKTQLKRVIDEGSIKPAALQIENHPQIAQQELVDFAQSEGIVVMGYSPLGSLVKRYGQELPGPKIHEPRLVDIARKYGKTTPQIVLRWLVDRKVVPIAKSVKTHHLKENIDIFDFSLTEEEIATISNFDENRRYTIPSFWQNHPYYPFEKVDNPVADPFVAKNN